MYIVYLVKKYMYKITPIATHQLLTSNECTLHTPRKSARNRASPQTGRNLLRAGKKTVCVFGTSSVKGSAPTVRAIRMRIQPPLLSSSF